MRAGRAVVEQMTMHAASQLGNLAGRDLRVPYAKVVGGQSQFTGSYLYPASPFIKDGLGVQIGWLSVARILEEAVALSVVAASVLV